MSPTSRCVGAFCTWWRSWTGTAAGFCPGGCRTRWSRPFVAKHSRKRSTGTIPRRSSIQTRGSQFTSTEFTGLLKGAGVRISMDGRGRWMDNVFIERLWRSLKYECVYLNAFETGSEARQGIGHWIDLYNSERPHSAHAGATPEEVYTGLKKHSERDLALRLAPSQNFPYWRQQELRSPP